MLVARLVLLEEVDVLQQAAGRADRDHGRALACRLCRTAAVSPRNVARRRLGGRERGLRCGVRCAGLALRLEQQVAPPHLPVCLRSPGTAPDSAGARTSYVRHSCSAGTRESHLSLFGLPFTLLIRVLGLVARYLQAVLAPVHVPRLLRQDVQAACSTELWLSTGVRAGGLLQPTSYINAPCPPMVGLPASWHLVDLRRSPAGGALSSAPSSCSSTCECEPVTLAVLAKQ